jgi:hypothetical protein
VALWRREMSMAPLEFHRLSRTVSRKIVFAQCVFEAINFFVAVTRISFHIFHSLSFARFICRDVAKASRRDSEITISNLLQPVAKSDGFARTSLPARIQSKRLLLLARCGIHNRDARCMLCS